MNLIRSGAFPLSPLTVFIPIPITTLNTQKASYAYFGPSATNEMTSFKNVLFRHFAIAFHTLSCSPTSPPPQAFPLQSQVESSWNRLRICPLVTYYMEVKSTAQHLCSVAQSRLNCSQQPVEGWG